MVDCNCRECVTGEEDIFSQGECLVRQSDLELRRLKANMHSSNLGVLAFVLPVVVSILFFFGFALFQSAYLLVG